MLKRIKDSILDILRQADWLLLCLCCGAALFGLVMIASATNFLGSRKMVIVQACAIVLGGGDLFPHVPDRPDGGIQAVEVAAGLRHRPVPAAENTSGH